MYNLKKILRYIFPYWTRVLLNVLFNFLSVGFSLFTLNMVIPFMSILFQTKKETYELMPFRLDFDALINNFYYYLNLVIAELGEVTTLILLCVVVILASLLKNGFNYLALYHLAPVRN
ncbi:MAG: hypothetical protein ACLFMU_09355, partial [Bacteroidales bacterium]